MLIVEHLEHLDLDSVLIPYGLTRVKAILAKPFSLLEAP
jgi:hypothetical protein